MAASDRLAKSKLRGLFVWVLADSPSTEFYTKLGGEPVAEVVRNFAGTPLKELGYGWANTPSYE